MEILRESASIERHRYSWFYSGWSSISYSCLW